MYYHESLASTRILVLCHLLLLSFLFLCPFGASALRPGNSDSVHSGGLHLISVLYLLQFSCYREWAAPRHGPWNLTSPDTMVFL